MSITPELSMTPPGRPFSACSGRGSAVVEERGVCAVVRDVNTGCWLQFRGARRVLTGSEPADVVPVLEEVERLVEREGGYAVGFLSYEAAAGWGGVLQTHAPDDFPLVWFAMFDAPAVLPSLPPVAWDGPMPTWRAGITREDYRAGFERVRSYIAAGDTYQVNYTFRLDADWRVDPWDHFRRLMMVQDPPCGAFLDTGGDWVICSASPELYLRRAGRDIESWPMKGTAPRGRWAEEDRWRARVLKESGKERAEHVMIVDMVRNDLGRIARTGSVRVAPLFSVERYPTVWQMVSRVRARTDASLVRIFESTFPPASITGAPKRRTMEIIRELEERPRRIYTGALGFVSAGEAQFNVAIRTVLLNRRTRCAEYGVGGGVVWDSTDQGEFEECAVKARILHVRRPSFDLLETLWWRSGRGYFLLRDHLRRLAGSAAYFGYALDVRAVERSLREEARAFPPGSRRVRLLVSRSGGFRIEHVALAGRVPSGKVGLGTPLVDPEDPFLYHKTTHRVVYERALGLCPGCEDVILFNTRGEATESTRANLVVQFGSQLYTPPLACGLLPGVARARALRSGRLRERVIRAGDLAASAGVWLLNSVRGMWPIDRPGPGVS